MSTTTTTQTQSHSFGVAKETPSYEIPRGDTKGTLSFFQSPADGSKPWNYVEIPTDGPQRNYGAEEQTVTIHDIRGSEKNYDMNVNGFGVLGGVQSEEHEFRDDEKVKEVYYPEVEKLLLDNVEGAKRVFIFDHTIRRSDPNAHRAPVNRAHIVS